MVGDILQPTHLLFVLAVALLVLGPKRLPEVGRTLGSGLRDFRQALSGEESPQRPQRPEPEWIEAPAEPTTYPQYEEHHQPATADIVAAPAVAAEPAPTDAPPQLVLTPQSAPAPTVDAEPATASTAPSEPSA